MGISKGKITDIHMFDRILTKEEMKGMTLCPGSRLMGNIINSTTPYTLHGPNVKEIEIHEEEICPVRNFSAIFFISWIWDQFTSQEICKKIGMEVAYVANENDKENLLFYMQHIWPGGAGGWIQTLIIKRPNNESGTWVEMNTNETTILEWAENSPGNAEYGRMHVHNDKVNDPWILLEGSGTNMWMPTLCTIDTQKAYQQDWRTKNNYPYRLFVKILGLCSSSLYDYRYVWVPDEYVYISRLGSELRFIEDGHWQLSSEAYVKWLKKEYPIYSAKITASRWSMGLGKFDVNCENNLCTKVLI